MTRLFSVIAIDDKSTACVCRVCEGERVFEGTQRLDPRLVNHDRGCVIAAFIEQYPDGCAPKERAADLLRTVRAIEDADRHLTSSTVH